MMHKLLIKEGFKITITDKLKVVCGIHVQYPLTDNFSKDMENIIKNQEELKGKNTVTGIKYTFDGFITRLDRAGKKY